ncbi:MAG: tripartite tricarboxylate transporter substrate binding protein [Burkholderiaceae bacterium]|nr:tripartite tricarboxylate transporter substrate binding protein [Burkholderiaceae bacterium]
MNIPFRKTLAATVLFVLGAAGCIAADELPSGKPIAIIVGFVAGGASDTSTRMVARKVSENIGQPVVVENRPGAGATIATQYVVNAKPDGATLILGTIGPIAVAPHLMQLGYDPIRDLAPITMGVNFPNVLVVHPSLNVKTLSEFIALAKKEPGKLTYAATGVGSASHLAGELFNQRAGVEILHVPYKGGAAAMVDLLGGRISAYYSTPSTAEPHIKSGKLIALATTGLKRSAMFPDIPTIAESGYPGFNASNWYAYLAPAKTPEATLDRLNTEIVRALNDPDVRTQLAQHGLVPDPMTRKELADFIDAESRTWAKVVKERNIKME